MQAVLLRCVSKSQMSIVDLVGKRMLVEQAGIAEADCKVPDRSPETV